MSDGCDDRECSWEVEGVTLAVLRQVSSLGYRVSVFRLPGSLLGAPSAVEMHATDTRPEPAVVHIARVVESEDADPVLACAVVLAEMVGIELEDG